MNQPRILLTGGSGMVGRNVLEHPEIHKLDVLAPSSSKLNLLDFQAVQAYLQANKPDMVIHAAGKVGGIQANIREPVGFFMDNLDITSLCVKNLY
jgi:GDP-L-fucose synthase